MTSKITTEIFIQRAREKHGDKYDYSKVEYKDAKTKVCIICPTHGEFWQEAHAHSHGRGCPICAKEYRRRLPKYTTSSFIVEAQKVHGCRYSYDKTVFANMETKVCITCPIHGDFWTLPSVHLAGHLCRLCATLSLKKYTKEMCVEKAKLCDSRHEFEIKYNGYYNAARYNGWYNECIKHMPSKTILSCRCIYAYIFNINTSKFVYIGLTYNLTVRDRRHHKEGSVYEFAKGHNITIYAPKQLTDYLNEDDASVMEGKWLEYFIQQGYTPINRIKTGSLGGQKTLDYNIDTIEKTLIEASSFTEWRESCSTYYDYIRKLHLDSLIDKYFPDRMRRIYDDFDECYNAFSKCATLSEVKKRFPGALASAKRHGWECDLKPLCNPSHVKWTENRCKELIRTCISLRELRNKYNGAYQTIRKNGWLYLLKDIKRDTHVKYEYTIDDIRQICSKFHSRAELFSSHPEVVTYCSHHNIDLFELNGWENPRKRSVCQILDGKIIRVFDSTVEAAAFINGDRKRLWTCLNQHKPYMGYMWEYTKKTRIT